MANRSFCSLTALLGVTLLGTPAFDNKTVPATRPSRERRATRAVPSEEEDPQLAECEQEEIGWSYSVWRKALIRRMTILSLSPRPAHYQAADRLRRVVEWEEENQVEWAVILQNLRGPSLWGRATQASRLLGQLRERLKEPLFCVASGPGDKGHEWVVGNARQLFATLEDLENRQRSLAIRAGKIGEPNVTRLKRLKEAVEWGLFKDLDAETGGKGPNKP